MSSVKQKSLTIYGWLSIAAALLTIGLNFWAYFLTDSVGLLANALESLINLVAAIIMLCVLHVAARPPDKSHPYGHEKIEYFSSGAEGILILLAAVSIAVTSWERLWNPQPLEQLDIGIAICVGASFINLIVAQILIRAGKRYRSIPLESDGKHLMTDVWTMFGILVGIGLIYTADSFQESLMVAKQLGMNGWEILDPIIAILVAINIVFSGVHLISRTAAGLIDSSLPDDEQAAIIEVLDKVLEIHDITYQALRTRYSGARRFMSVHILVSGDWSVQQSHELVDSIEQNIKTIFENIDIETRLKPIELSISQQNLPEKALI